MARAMQERRTRDHRGNRRRRENQRVLHPPRPEVDSAGAGDH
jgi:hypothetical protein